MWIEGLTIEYTGRDGFPSRYDSILFSSVAFLKIGIESIRAWIVLSISSFVCENEMYTIPGCTKIPLLTNSCIKRLRNNIDSLPSESVPTTLILTGFLSTCTLFEF